MSGIIRTIYIDKKLWGAAKDKAARRLSSLSAVVSELLRRWVAGEIEI